MNDRSMRVAVATAQTIVSPNLRANGAAIRRALSEAAAAGARLIVFCEGSLSGYAKSEIAKPGDWASFEWDAQETELRQTAALCGKLGVFAALGGAHRLTSTPQPHNSLYVLSDQGRLLTRYDKRFLSNTEINGWYTPGVDPIIFEVDGYRFGCAICIEVQFPELFAEYERAGADAVLFPSYGIGEQFQIALRGHAATNCIWIAAARPAQQSLDRPSCVIGPDGRIIANCEKATGPDMVIAVLNRDDPTYEVALRKARPWRAQARSGTIYRDKITSDPRSRDRTEY
jgi:deaminated glutathione amidase